MGSRLNLYCGVEEGKGGYRSALGLGGVTERRIEVRDVSAGPRESRREYPRAIHPRDRRGERSPPRGFFSVGYANLGGGALTVSWLRSFVHHLCVFVG